MPLFSNSSDASYQSFNESECFMPLFISVPGIMVGSGGTITEIKNSLVNNKSRFEQAASVNLKIGQLRLSSLRNWGKKE